MNKCINLDQSVGSIEIYTYFKDWTKGHLQEERNKKMEGKQYGKTQTHKVVTTTVSLIVKPHYATL